ncbi:uncharacterized protein V6R79_001753 [Siganus canaliculatus]
MAAAMGRPHGAQDRLPGQRIINCELSRIVRRSQLHARVAHSGLRRKGAEISLFALPTVALCQVESVHSRNEQRLRLPDFWDILIGGDRLQSLVPDPCEDAEFSPSTDKVCTPERRAESRITTTCCRSTSDEQSPSKAPERHLCFTAEQRTERSKAPLRVEELDVPFLVTQTVKMIGAEADNLKPLTVSRCESRIQELLACVQPAAETQTSLLVLGQLVLMYHRKSQLQAQEHARQLSQLQSRLQVAECDKSWLVTEARTVKEEALRARREIQTLRAQLMASQPPPTEWIYSGRRDQTSGLSDPFTLNPPETSQVQEAVFPPSEVQKAHSTEDSRCHLVEEVELKATLQPNFKVAEPWEVDPLIPELQAESVTMPSPLQVSDLKDQDSSRVPLMTQLIEARSVPRKRQSYLHDLSGLDFGPPPSREPPAVPTKPVCHQPRFGPQQLQQLPPFPGRRPQSPQPLDAGADPALDRNELPAVPPKTRKGRRIKRPQGPPQLREPPTVSSTLVCQQPQLSTKQLQQLPFFPGRRPQSPEPLDAGADPALVRNELSVIAPKTQKGRRRPESPELSETAKEIEPPVIAPENRKGRRRPQSPELSGTAKKIELPVIAPETRKGRRRQRKGRYPRHPPVSSSMPQPQRNSPDRVKLKASSYAGHKLSREKQEIPKDAKSQEVVELLKRGLRRKGAEISLFALPTVALCQVESVHSRNEQRLRLPDFWDILIGGDRLQSLVPDPCEDAEFSPSTDKVCTPERRAESRITTTCCRSTSDEQSPSKAPERHLCFTAEQRTTEQNISTTERHVHGELHTAQTLEEHAVFMSHVCLIALSECIKRCPQASFNSGSLVA